MFSHTASCRRVSVFARGLVSFCRLCKLIMIWRHLPLFFGAARPPVMPPSLITGATVVKSAFYQQSRHIHLLEENNIPVNKIQRNVYLSICVPSRNGPPQLFVERTVFVNKEKNLHFDDHRPCCMCCTWMVCRQLS